MDELAAQVRRASELIALCKSGFTKPKRRSAKFSERNEKADTSAARSISVRETPEAIRPTVPTEQDKSTRDMKEIQPWVDKIKAAYPEVAKLDNDALRAKTEELKEYILSLIHI